MKKDASLVPTLPQFREREGNIGKYLELLPRFLSAPQSISLS